MKKFFIAIIPALLIGCSAQHTITDTSKTSTDLVVCGKLYTAFYQQQAAEYSALCYQAYNIARLRLDEALLHAATKPLSIITDIDETILNNSPYSVHQALQGKDYDYNSWIYWTSRGQCDTLSGAVSFFNYVASKNVEVFYITNRNEEERQGTLNNLKLYGFPYVDSVHLILKEDVDNSKESRRKKVAATHTIILLLGDNLGDFSDLFDKKTVSERLQNTQLSSAEFGKMFIVLPNPNYGDWENAQYQYNYKLTPAQKDSSIKSVLKSY